MILVNGISTGSIPALDRGLLYGDGLFETMRLAADGRCALWPWHLKRLTEGCERLGFPAPDEGQLLDEVRDALTPGLEMVVRLTLTRGQGPRGYAPPHRPSVNRIVQSGELPEPGTEPLRLMVCTTRLSRSEALGGMKHLCRLENVLAAVEVRDAGLSEGLVMDAEGCLVEAISANVFLLVDGQWRTPDVGLAGVAGVYRAWLLEQADIAVTSLTRTDLGHAQALFIANSVTGIRAVSAIAEMGEYDIAPVAAFMEQVRSPWSAR